jgi:hypothetical protein
MNSSNDNQNKARSKNRGLGTTAISDQSTTHYPPATHLNGTFMLPIVDSRTRPSLLNPSPPKKKNMPLPYLHPIKTHNLSNSPKTDSHLTFCKSGIDIWIFVAVRIGSDVRQMSFCFIDGPGNCPMGREGTGRIRIKEPLVMELRGRRGCRR